ncbi:MAG TPA: HAD family hydrolase [Solirubrobacterales bacterium]|nr:HAD family hydrolase [Solirubrobacterales bacterium]
MGAPVAAVTFDFWNTIARVPAGAMTEARRRAVAAACDACGVEVEAEALALILDEVGARYQGSWEAGEHFHPDEGVELLVGALGVEDAAREAVGEAFLTAARTVEIGLAPDIEVALEDLGGRGVRIGIVCDVGFTGGEQLRRLLGERGLLAHFSGWAFSDEVGHYKPSPRIFEAALESLGARPEQSMHVGDLRRTDIAGASALGMRTARYKGLHDDPDLDAGPEAEFVLASHRELPGLIDHLSGAYR